MIWLIGLALAGTKADLKSGDRALADNDGAAALQHYVDALAPPALKDKLRDDAWNGMLAASKRELFVSTGPPLDRARRVADAWASVADQAGSLGADDKKAGAELVVAALNAIVSANDPADAERMKGVARALTALDHAGLGALSVGQYQLAIGDRDAAISTFEAAIAHGEASGSGDIMLPTVVEALAMQLWQGDRTDPGDEGDVSAALEILEAGIRRLEAQQAKQDTADLRESAQRLTLLRLTLLSSLPRDPRTLPAFEAALEEQPENVSILVALAGVHDQLSDVDASEKLYSRALELDPDHTMAHFGMAAVYVNRATKLKQSTVEMTDYAEIGRVEDEAMAIHLKAKPHFEAVLAADPSDREVQRQLLTLAILEEDSEAIRRYKASLAR